MAFNKWLSEKHIKDVKEGGMCEKSKMLFIDKNTFAMDKKSDIISVIIQSFSEYLAVQI